MENLLYLALAAGIVLVGSLLLWLFSRERVDPYSSMKDHEAKMTALSPDDEPNRTGRRRR